MRTLMKVLLYLAVLALPVFLTTMAKLFPHSYLLAPPLMAFETGMASMLILVYLTNWSRHAVWPPLVSFGLLLGLLGVPYFTALLSGEAFVLSGYTIMLFLICFSAGVLLGKWSGNPAKLVT